MPLKIVRNRLDALANAVANDEKQKATAPKVERQRVVECNFINIIPGCYDQFDQRVPGPLEVTAGFALQVRRSPTRQFLRIVQDLANHFPTTFWVLPELAFNEDRQT